MDVFAFETKIREVVFELSKPLVNRLEECLKQQDLQQLNFDNLKQQIRQINDQQQNHHFEANRKYLEVDQLQKQQKKIEQDISKNISSTQQTQQFLKSRIDTISDEFEQQKNNSQFVINTQIKTQQDLDQLAKKSAENTETFNKKIDEFFKDYYTFFVDSRNQVNKITKDQQLLLKDVQNQGQQLEKLGVFKDLQDQYNTSITQRIEWISNEMNQLVNKEYFKFVFDKEEKSRMEDNQNLKGLVQQLQSQVQIYNISFDERVKGLEMFEVQYRQQLNGFQQQLNLQVENYQTFYKDISKQLQSHSTSINSLEDFKTNINEKIQILVNAQLGVVSTNLNLQIKKISDNFNSLKQNISKEMAQEFSYKLEDIRQQLLSETSKQFSIKLVTIEQQIEKLQHKQYQKDAEVQVIISQNSLSQQEELNNYILEQIDLKLQNSQIKGSGSRQQNRRNSIVPHVSQGGGFNLISVGQSETNTKAIISDQLADQIEDMKTDIQMLFEMREEFEEKFKVFEVDFSVAISNFDKNHSHVLKLKSDIFNDTEYLNNQIKILFREKELLNKKISQIIQLISGETEITQITVAYLLKQLKDPIKFSSDQGAVFEFRNDICNYRTSTYTVEDLLKKSLQSLIDFWDRIEMLEVREYNPHWYFHKHIFKNHIALSRTLDKSLERTIKTQTIADGDDIVKKSSRHRQTSLKQSLVMNLDSNRHKKVTVRGVYKQQEKEDSIDGFPRVLKK